MGLFTTYNSFKHIAGTRKLYSLCGSLSWYVGKKDSQWLLVVPDGYRVDVSAPRFTEWFIDVHDTDLLAAAAVHDYLLDLGFDKAFASSEFRRCLVARGVGVWKAWAFFWATLVWTVLFPNPNHG